MPINVGDHPRAWSAVRAQGAGDCLTFAEGDVFFSTSCPCSAELVWLACGSTCSQWGAVTVVSQCFYPSPFARFIPRKIERVHRALFFHSALRGTQRSHNIAAQCNDAMAEASLCLRLGFLHDGAVRYGVSYWVDPATLMFERPGCYRTAGSVQSGHSAFAQILESCFTDLSYLSAGPLLRALHRQILLLTSNLLLLRRSRVAS